MSGIANLISGSTKRRCLVFCLEPIAFDFSSDINEFRWPRQYDWWLIRYFRNFHSTPKFSLILCIVDLLKVTVLGSRMHYFSTLSKKMHICRSWITCWAGKTRELNNSRHTSSKFISYCRILLNQCFYRGLPKTIRDVDFIRRSINTLFSRDQPGFKKDFFYFYSRSLPVVSIRKVWFQWKLDVSGTTKKQMSGFWKKGWKMRKKITSKGSSRWLTEIRFFNLNE